MPKVERRKRCTYFVGVFKTKTSKTPTHVKIGLATQGQVERRVNQLRTGSAHDLRVLFTLEGAAWERKFHRRWSKLRVRGEFFRATPPLMKMLADLKEIRRMVSLLESPTDGTPLFKAQRLV